MVELLTSGHKGNQSGTRCTTGCLSDLLPAAGSHLLKFPEFPQIVPQAGIQSLNTWARGIVSYSGHPRGSGSFESEVRMTGNIDLSSRKLAFRADCSYEGNLFSDVCKAQHGVRLWMPNYFLLVHVRGRAVLFISVPVSRLLLGGRVGVCVQDTVATPAVSPWSHSYALLTPSSALEVFTATDVLAIKALIDNTCCLSRLRFYYCLV